MPRPFAALLTAILSIASTASAQTSYPMLMSVKPAAVQAGQTAEVELESRYSMFGAYQVFVAGEGVTGEVATPMELGADGKAPDLTKIKLRFTAAADALPGVRDFRIVGPAGPSTLGQLVIVSDPVINEVDPNDAAETALPVTLPATVCGTVEKAEDVDYFRFTVSQPTVLSFHCRAMRLEDRIHDLQSHVDPIITIKSAQTGSTVAAADNYFAADPLLSHPFEPGEYLLEVRDVRYQGNAYWTYAIEIHDRPFVSQVYPFGVAAGQPVDLRCFGFNLPENDVVNVTVPAEFGPQSIRLPLGETPSNPVAVFVSELPLVAEAEGDNSTPAAATQVVPVGSGITGRIEAESDIDCFRFEAKQGDRISVETYARRAWSPLDPIIRILTGDGAALVENDDMRVWNKKNYQDSQIEFWAAPADGPYAVEIRDVHLRGGEDFVYYVKLEKSRPDFDLVLDSDKTWLTPGTSAAIFARAVRKNGFEGEIALEVEGLPPGVTAQCGRILAGKGQDGCIILQAAADAQPAAANIRVYGSASHRIDDATTLSYRNEAKHFQEIYMPGGGRHHYPVDMHTVGIGAPGDLRGVTLSTNEVTLKPGESVKIDVTISRAEGFAQNVTLDLLFQHLSSVFANTLPEGVTIDTKNSKTLLSGGETAGYITLTAAANAPPVEKQQCCVMANISINFVMKSTWSSPPLLVSVAAP